MKPAADRRRRGREPRVDWLCTFNRRKWWEKPNVFSLPLDGRTSAAIERKFDEEIFYEVDSLAVVINTKYIRDPGDYM